MATHTSCKSSTSARRQPARPSWSWIKQVASALAATHAKTIVHRDLKPGNIYLLEAAGETDFVKVLDFGISKVLAGTTHLTRAAAVVGTPDYMSPEQAEGKVDDIDARTDQWALACIAWECLSGERPFVGESVPSVLFQVVHRPPPALLPKVAGLHPGVEDVLLRALAKNKHDRFANVNDFAVALDAAVFATAVAPSIDPTAFPSTPSFLFWSSSPLAGSSSSAWYVCFDYGYSYSVDVSYASNVRCVR